MTCGKKITFEQAAKAREVYKENIALEQAAVQEEFEHNQKIDAMSAGIDIELKEKSHKNIIDK